MHECIRCIWHVIPERRVHISSSLCGCGHCVLGAIACFASTQQSQHPHSTSNVERCNLQAARAAEQCDAEGWLLRQGAQDHAAQHELTEASNITAIDSADAGAVHVSGMQILLS